MSETRPDHLYSLMTVLAHTNAKDAKQMRRVFELSALLLQPKGKSFWNQFAKFPFHEIEPCGLVSVLSNPLDAEIVMKAPIDWLTPVSVPSMKTHGVEQQYPFKVNSQHTVSLAGLFLLDTHLQYSTPKSEDHAEHNLHEQRCLNFQRQCLDVLEASASVGNAQIHWGPMGTQCMSIKDVALAVNSPHVVRWLNDFSWKTGEELEATLLSVLSSSVHFGEHRSRATYGKEKPQISQWLDVFNTILEKAEKGAVQHVDLLRKITLPHSKNTSFTVAQIIFKILEEERGLSRSERLIRAKSNPQHKVKESDLGPEIENSGKYILKNIFKNSLHQLPLEQQQQVVKDVLHTITEDPRGLYHHLRTHCASLMEAAPVSLRETVKREMLNNTAIYRARNTDENRNGLYLFDGLPIYKGILTREEAKCALEREANVMLASKEIWPLVLLMHVGPPQMQIGISNIIKIFQSSPANNSQLRLELAALVARVEMGSNDAPKRKM